MPVKGSKSYVWFTEQVLGTGQCYFGRHKSNGASCVVKVSKDDSPFKLIEKFKKLNNRNVVKFLAIEAARNNDTICAFEFCNEYCLQKLLEKPENIFGLDDIDVINFHEDVCNGLDALVDLGLPKNFFLKPTNILCVCESDGSSTFKITDYYYESYETGKDLYCIDIVQKQKTVDPLVWSLGAVICHVILGVPPFGIPGQNEASHVINARKEKHIFISMFESDKFEWESDFPWTVKLSFPLQKFYANIVSDCLDACKKTDPKQFFKTRLRGSRSDALAYVLNLNNLHYRTVICKGTSASFINESTATVDKIIFDHKFIKEIKEFNTHKDRASKEDPAIHFNIPLEFNVQDDLEVLKTVFKNVRDKSIEDDVVFARNHCGFVKFCLRIFSKILLSKRSMKQILNKMADEIDADASAIRVKLNLLDVISRSSETPGSSKHLLERENYHILKSNIRQLQRSSTNSDHDRSCSGTDADPLHAQTSLNLLSGTYSESQCLGILRQLDEETSKTYATFVEEIKKQFQHNESQVRKYEKVKLKEKVQKAYQILSYQLNCLSENICQFNKITLETKKVIDAKNVSELNSSIDKLFPKNCHSINDSGYNSNCQLDYLKEPLERLDALIADCLSRIGEFGDILTFFVKQPS